MRAVSLVARTGVFYGVEAKPTRPHCRLPPRLVQTTKTSLLRKASLIREVLFTYAVFRRRMTRQDIRDVVSAARQTSGRGIPEATYSGDAWALASHLNRAVDRTLSPLPTDSRCLIQSIVLCRLLAVRGMPSIVVIGARSHPEFLAHAWVEYRGRPVSPVLGFGEARLTEL